MRRILLVIEDQSELAFIRTLLEKLEFDVESAESENAINDKLINFLPALVIASGQGQKISGQGVLKKVKKKGHRIKLLLLYPQWMSKDLLFVDGVKADGVIESPVSPKSFVSQIARTLDLDEKDLLKKFERMPLSVFDDDAKSKSKPKIKSSFVVSFQNYQKGKPPQRYIILDEDKIIPNQKLFDPAKIKAVAEEYQKDKGNRDADLDSQKQVFVKKLFKK